MSNGFPEYSKDHHCEGFNVIQSTRLTVGQPKSALNTIHVFGGSTVFGTAASDDQTIPSYIQLKLGSTNSNYKVVNNGIPSANVKQQLARLEKINIKKDDIVIFYDGGNDVWQSNIYQKPDESILDFNKNHKLDLFLYKVTYKLNEYSSTYKLISKYVLSDDDCKLSSEEAARNAILTKRGMSQYFDNIRKAKVNVESKGATFYHFFQPLLFSRSDELSNYEKGLIPYIFNRDKCNNFEKIITISYGEYRREYLKLLNQINGSDLSFELNPILYDREFFIDWIHVTAPGNEIIANKILKKLKLKF